MSERERIVKSPSANFVMDRVIDDIYENSSIMCSVQEVIGRQVDDLLIFMADVEKQKNINTATWGLKYWADEFNVKISSGMTYAEVRKLVNSKRQFIAPPNETALAKYISSQLGRNVEIEQNVGPYKFYVIIDNSSSEPVSYRRAYKLTKEARQAHLCFDIGMQTSRGYVVESDKTIYKFKNPMTGERGLRAGLIPKHINFGKVFKSNFKIESAGKKQAYDSVFTGVTKGQVFESKLSIDSTGKTYEFESKEAGILRGIRNNSTLTIESKSSSQTYKIKPTGIELQFCGEGNGE